MNNVANKVSLKQFQATRLVGGTGGLKKNDLVIEISFTYYSLLLMFDSMSKLQQWMDKLEKISC